jgi:thiol:disulfide interchange protein
MTALTNPPMSNDDLVNTLNALFGEEPAPVVTSNPTPVVTSNPAPVAAPASTSGRYILYSESALSTALANNKRVIINFRASRCPNCTASSNNIIQNVDLLPSDVVILEADFDTATDLKAKHGVSRQTTFVFLDDQ